MPTPLFDPVAEAYDRARPGYPKALFGALGPLAGLRVVEGGAGTGLATLALCELGADVTAFDVAPEMLRRARNRIGSLRVVVADAARMPVRDSCADLLCFAQAWHWLDPHERAIEAARVLRPDGRWAGWWSHARADGERWFDESWNAIEEECAPTSRTQRDKDWGGDLRASGLFDVGDRIVVPWTRTLPVADWLTELTSHSYIAALAQGDRTRLITAIGSLIRDAFPSGEMNVRYETWLWIARVRSVSGA